MFEFHHGIADFNEIGILRRAGVKRGTPMFEAMFEQVTTIINAVLSGVAAQLNSQLIVRYQQDMLDIYEYRMFPRYVDIMTSALSWEDHKKVITRDGVYHALFVNTDKLGNLADLQEIQQEAYPQRGTAERWYYLYTNWVDGYNTKYADTVNERLDIMKMRNMAPFWELIESGNDGGGAYPVNGPMGTLSKFTDTYQSAMSAAMLRIVNLVHSSIGTNLTIKDVLPEVVQDGKEVKGGYRWYSRNLNKIFVEAGSERIVQGRLTGRGFVLDSSGKILRRWYGYIPK